jgi:CHAD domain-containing protein
MSSRSYRLKAKESTAEGLRRIALGRAAKALDELAAAREGALTAAIHGARKDLKKLRAVLRLIREELGQELFKAENRRFRDAGRLLAESRDAGVKLETLAALQNRFGDDLPDAPSERWQASLTRERDAAADTARGETASRIDRARRAIEAGRDRIDDWPLGAGSWKLVGPGIRESYRGGRRAMKRVRKNPSSENVHEWRKRVKDLWYQLRIVRDAWPELLGQTADQAHELADLLGDHHDLAVLEEDLASRRDVGKRKAFKASIAQRQEELLARALANGRRLYAEKPTAFSRRLERYWDAWRET